MRPGAEQWRRAVIGVLGVALLAGPVAAAPQKGKTTRKSAGKPAAKQAGKPAAKSAGKPAKGDPAKPAEAELALPKLDDHPLIAALNKPIESGPGVLVCEPVGTKADAETADMGAGCGRWLHLLVGGQGEFGRTPMWTTVDQARIEIKKPNLRLTRDEALKLAPRLGLTHVVTGEIEGSAEKCTLRYQVTAVAGKANVGDPVSASGTAVEVIAGLEDMAKRLATTLGAPKPKVTAAGETPAEMAVLGRLPWAPHARITGAPREQLLAAYEAGRSRRRDAPDVRPITPLLGTFLAAIYFGSAGDSGRVTSSTIRLWTRLGDCTLALAEMTKQCTIAGTRMAGDSLVPQLPLMSNHYPNNLSLRVANLYRNLLPHRDDAKLRADPMAWRTEIRRREDEARKWAEQAVQSSPGLAESWILLAEVAGRLADGMRRGRFINALTEQEFEFCMKAYAEQSVFAMKGAELAPESAYAWNQLSVYAASLGTGRLADAACERALKLAPTDYDVVWWACQVYQEKWLDDPIKLRRAAQLGVAGADGWSVRERSQLALAVHRGGLPELAAKIVRTDIEREALAKWIKQDEEELAKQEKERQEKP